MTISNHYQKAIKSEFIKDFIRTNKRSPTDLEIADGLRYLNDKYQAIDQLGFFGIDSKKIQFREVSSANKENQNIEALIKDMKVAQQKLVDTHELLNNQFKSLLASNQKAKNKLLGLESRLDNLLLLKQDLNLFKYSIEENFDSQLNVDFTQTTAIPVNGMVYSAIDSSASVSDINVKFSMFSNVKIAGQNVSNLEDAIIDNGKFFNAIAYVKERNSAVNFNCEFLFDTNQECKSLEISLDSVNKDVPLELSIFTILNGAATLIETVQVSSSFIKRSLPAGLISGVSLVFVSRDAVSTVTNNQFAHVLTLNKITFLNQGYSNSVLVCGPYNVLNEEGEPVYFSKATMSACTSIPDRTSISFYLSADGTAWKYVNPDNENIVYFGNPSKTNTYENLDTTVDAAKLVEESSLSDELAEDEAWLNFYIVNSYINTIDLNNIEIKRNLKSDYLIRNQPSPWTKDGNFYYSLIEIKESNGRQINVGNSKLWINNSPLSGVIYLKQGTYLIKIQSSEFLKVKDSFVNETELRAVDQKYPYNHYHLISGLDYPAGYVGAKEYNQFDKHYQTRMSYISHYKFSALNKSSKDYYSHFTSVRLNDKILFKVKTNKSFPNWKEELFDYDWIVSKNSNNQLYVKALFETEDPSLTPILDDFKIRII